MPRRGVRAEVGGSLVPGLPVSVGRAIVNRAVRSSCEGSISSRKSGDAEGAMAHPGTHMGNDPEPVPGPLTISPPQAEPLTHHAPDELRPRVAFSIVGIGASAGGLEAFIQLFRALPSDNGGLGFVLVQHLAPSHPSALPEILARAT